MTTATSIYPPAKSNPGREKAEKLRELADRHITSARNNRDISTEKRNKIIARAYLDLKDGLARVEDEDKRGVAAKRAELERKLYGIPNTADASAMISYRDALDRADQVGKESEAISLYNRARTSGDDHLARAVLATSFQRGWVDAINTFAEHNPDTDLAVNELWEIQNPTSSLGAMFDYVTAPPQEIRQYGETTLRNMAEGETSTSSIAVF